MSVQQPSTDRYKQKKGSKKKAPAAEMESGAKLVQYRAWFDRRAKDG